MSVSGGQLCSCRTRSFLHGESCFLGLLPHKLGLNTLVVAVIWKIDNHPKVSPKICNLNTVINGLLAPELLREEWYLLGISGKRRRMNSSKTLHVVITGSRCAVAQCLPHTQLTALLGCTLPPAVCTPLQPPWREMRCLWTPAPDSPHGWSLWSLLHEGPSLDWSGETSQEMGE